MLLNHPAIKQVNEKPILLLYSEEKSSFEHSSKQQSDVSEVYDEDKVKTSSQQLWKREVGNNKASLGMDVSCQNNDSMINGASRTSHTSLSITHPLEASASSTPFECYFEGCGQRFSSQHIWIKIQRRLNRSSFKRMVIN